MLQGVIVLIKNTEKFTLCMVHVLPNCFLPFGLYSQ